MLDNTYTPEFNAAFTVFEFDSMGPKGTIRKIAQYTQINNTNYYNLGFGDKNFETNDIDDLTVTNNGDSQKVLATVASTLIAFTNKHPKAFVVATGSTSVRTRLYRIGICNNLAAIEKTFEVLGLKENNWHKFEVNTDYSVFLVKRKT